VAFKLSVFVKELKRRKVYHVGAVYVVAGLGVLGAAELILEPLGLDAVRPFIVILTILGFPIALVLAWAYEVKPEEPGPVEGSSDGASLSPPHAEDEVSPTPQVTPPNGAAEQQKSIVVLPFDNLSPDPGDAYFSDGLTEEITSHLACCGEMRVISRNSAMALKDTRKKTVTIGKELNVQCVLEGSVRRAGDDLRITAQLIDAGTDTHIWTETYNGTLEDVFDIQERVARSIVEALQLTLGPDEERRLTERPIDDLQAYECYLRARHDIDRFTEQSLAQAIRTLEHGLELFPENPLLTATLGEAQYLQYDAGYVTDESVLDRAEELATRALSLNPDCAYGKKLLGLLERGRGSLTQACRHMKAAYDAEPNDAGIMLYTATFLSVYAGRFDIARPIYERLLEIDPLNPLAYLVVGLFRVSNGDPETGTTLIRRFHRMSPEMPWGRFWIAHALAADGRTVEAIEELDGASQAGLPDPVGPLARFVRLALSGRQAEALSALDEETKAYGWNDPDFSYLMIGYYALIDRTDEALEWLQHALDRDYINYPYLAETGPFLQNLRGEEQFKALLEEVEGKWQDFEV
jgi:TolB-like protein/predicted Zn-dependent protease